LDNDTLEGLTVTPKEETDLDLRYVVQLSGEALEGESVDHWLPVVSYEEPLDAVRGCSNFVNTLKNVVGIGVLDDLPVFTRVLRVFDAEDEKIVLWEEDGSLHFDPNMFDSSTERS
tara:strand:+ start:2421 stop:2768 length:348 start_codon:yes stop_codon:yes gene_type:complete